MQRSLSLSTFFVLLAMFANAAEKPNILVIMGDDVGYWNLSYNNDGMMTFMHQLVESS